MSRKRRAPVRTVHLALVRDSVDAVVALVADIRLLEAVEVAVAAALVERARLALVARTAPTGHGRNATTAGLLPVGLADRLHEDRQSNAVQHLRNISQPYCFEEYKYPYNVLCMRNGFAD